MKTDLGKIESSFITANSLRFQLLSRSLMILAVLLVFIGMVQYAFMKENIYRNKTTSLKSQMINITPTEWDGMLAGQLQQRRPFIFVPGGSLSFFDNDGNYTILVSDPRAQSPPQLTSEQRKQLLNPNFHRGYILTGNGREEQLVTMIMVGDASGQIVGTAQVSTPTAPLKELLFRQLLIFLVLALSALVIGLLAFQPVLKRTLIPLSNMIDTATQIDAGNLDRRFPTRQGQIEVDRLADSFNGMLQRLEASFAAEKETQDMMRRFIADASHELRTPLTSIHGFVEVLLRGAANQPEQLNKALKSMHGESQRLNKLVRDLLLLSKLDRTPRSEMQKGLLDETLRSMEAQLRVLGGERRIIFTIQPGLECKYNADQIKQIVLNLYQNAVQHTDPIDGEIRVSLLKAHEQVKLAIQDNGPGISPEHISHIFERFYRSDASRTRREGGAGLGLSITKALVEAHGGTINVVSKVGEGTTVQVKLPEAGFEPT